MSIATEATEFAQKLSDKIESNKTTILHLIAQMQMLEEENRTFEPILNSLQKGLKGLDPEDTKTNEIVTKETIKKKKVSKKASKKMPKNQVLETTKAKALKEVMMILDSFGEQTAGEIAKKARQSKNYPNLKLFLEGTTSHRSAASHLGRELSAIPRGMVCPITEGRNGVRVTLKAHKSKVLGQSAKYSAKRV
jgi:hypothetical protein